MKTKPFENLIGKYITITKHRKCNCNVCYTCHYMTKYVKERIIEVGDYEPPDRSVGIFGSWLYIRTKSGWYLLINNGNVEKVIQIGGETVGKHKFDLL